MAMKNVNYRTKAAVIGGLIGLAGSIFRPFFLTMNNDPLIVFGIPGMILKMAGVGGCTWKSSFCPMSDFFGSIVTIALFAFISSLIGSIIGKIKHKQ